MAYLERFEPPELPADAATLRNKLTLGMVFNTRQIPASPSTVRLLMIYIITTDKAAREYMAGCRHVRDHINVNGGIKAYIEGVGHFENCINATKRALRALDRLGAQKGGPTVPRTIRKLAQSQTKTITDLRDAIEHMDADIVADSGVPEGLPHLLTIDKSGEILEIGTHQIPIADLQGIVRALHAAGIAIILALPTLADA